MFFRFLLDLLVLLLATPPAHAPLSLAPPPAIVRSAPQSGPQPPKKPPEKRPHDATWTDIKLLPGGRH